MAIILGKVAAHWWGLVGSFLIFGNTQAHRLSDRTASLLPVLGIVHDKKTSRRDSRTCSCTAGIFFCWHVCADDYNSCSYVIGSTGITNPNDYVPIPDTRPDTSIDGYANTNDYADASTNITGYADTSTNTPGYTGTDASTNTPGYADTSTNTDAQAQADGYANTNTDAQTDGYANTNADAQAQADA
jgi:hypothetical protein